MTFSSGLYLRQTPSAQQDPSLQVPISAQSQFDGLQNFFGFLDKGLETFTDVLATKKAYKQQMAKIAQANDARAAQLTASGISSQDAINMAWEETRYAVPQTWAEVGQQNAVSDLALKANNGWVGAQSSATVLETATSQLETIEEKGLNGVSLDSLNWIDGTGLQQIVRAVMPGADAMIPLGKNGAWVRDEILQRALDISDRYTKLERDANLALYLDQGEAQIRNAATFALTGKKIPDQVMVGVADFYEGNKAEASKRALTVFEELIEGTAYKNDAVDGVYAGNALEELMSKFGIFYSDMELQELAREAAVKGNKANDLKVDEVEDGVRTALTNLPDSKWNAQGIRETLDSAGFTQEMYDQGLDADLLGNNTRFTAPLERYELDIRDGTRTVDAAMAYLRSVTDSQPLLLEWEDRFKKAARALLSQRREGRSLALQEARLEGELYREGEPFRRKEWEGVFDQGTGYKVEGIDGWGYLSDEASAYALYNMNEADVRIRQAVFQGKMSYQQGQEALKKIQDGILNDFKRNTLYWYRSTPSAASP